MVLTTHTYQIMESDMEILPKFNEAQSILHLHYLMIGFRLHSGIQITNMQELRRREPWPIWKYYPRLVLSIFRALHVFI